MQTYEVAFATKTYPAAIPFDFERDCIMFDDWLAGCNLKGRGSFHTEEECFEELDLLTGPLDRNELDRIHNIAIPETFRFTVIEAGWLLTVYLAQRFPRLSSLCFYFEDLRDPYAEGPITLLPNSPCPTECSISRLHDRLISHLNEVNEDINAESTPNNSKNVI